MSDTGATTGSRGGGSVVIDMVHVYPTMAEAVKIVALSFFKDVSKMGSLCGSSGARDRSERLLVTNFDPPLS